MYKNYLSNYLKFTGIFHQNISDDIIKFLFFIQYFYLFQAMIKVLLF